MDELIPRGGRPISPLSDNDWKFCSKPLHVVCELMGIRKLTTNTMLRPMGNGGTERVMMGVFSMVENECQNYWEETAYCYS